MKWIKGYKLSKDLIIKKGFYDEIKDFRMDKNFVLIRVNHDEVKIELAVVNGTQVKDEDGERLYEITHILTGDKPQDIYWELVQKNLIELPDHFAYVGKELEKAFTCLREQWVYKQE